MAATLARVEARRASAGADISAQVCGRVLFLLFRVLTVPAAGGHGGA